MDVLISIKPEHTNKIENQLKNYEFRSYLIKDINKMYVYESNTSCLKYIMVIDNVVKYPDKIDENGIGNREFNNHMKYEYAYHIKHLYKLNKPITLTELKSRYIFYAPQKYTLASSHLDLIERINNSDKTQIF
ncbi:MAG: hypothetical protein IJ715_00755 [Bacilli bacterium]|nr:hypothetical protein [Bacilli bacterium]